MDVGSRFVGAPDIKIGMYYVVLGTILYIRYGTIRMV